MEFEILNRMQKNEFERTKSGERFEKYFCFQDTTPAGIHSFGHHFALA